MTLQQIKNAPSLSKGTVSYFKFNTFWYFLLSLRWLLSVLSLRYRLWERSTFSWNCNCKGFPGIFNDLRRRWSWSWSWSGDSSCSSSCPSLSFNFFNNSSIFSSLMTSFSAYSWNNLLLKYEEQGRGDWYLTSIHCLWINLDIMLTLITGKRDFPMTTSLEIFRSRKISPLEKH